MPYSHHSHSGEFCKHATGTLEEVVLEAIRQNFTVYGLTEHVPRYRIEDLYPEEEAISLKDLELQFDAFLVEAHRLKDKYASRITLLVGCETEFITETDLTGLESLLQRHGTRIEYLVGSVHHVNGVPIDFDKETFEKLLSSFEADCAKDPGPDTTEMEKVMSIYFDAQFELLQRFHPEVIGHFDLCRLYYPSLALSAYPSIVEKIKRNISCAVEYGALFEINAAAFRKGWRTAYPGTDVTQIISELGGRFTISDDSHGPQAVGHNYEKLYKYMRELELPELWYLSEGSISNKTGRKLVPVREHGEWKANRFWGSRKGSWDSLRHSTKLRAGSTGQLTF
ncbi:histidinol-phosphatase [Rickenella mellea]|uniref:Histidinol-phosphatase n=1 Tax=Rickenella mellea TaxID=50990 RepID=A0A4Y7Q0D6_9AGAM|nr:histidinol-phosphatase [Rickenella mellea]